MSDYTFVEVGGTYFLEWKLDSIKAVIDRIKDKAESTTAIVKWYRTDGEEILITSARLNFHSSRGKADLAKTLEKRAESYGFPLIHSDWDTIMEQLTNSIDDHLRKGEPSMLVGGLETPERYPFTYYPFIRKGRPNILFGFGGSGKSYFATLIGLMLSNRGYNEVSPVQPFSSEYLCGFCPPEITDCQNLEHGPSVLYLDWESSAIDLDRRVKAVGIGIGLKTPRLRYKRMYDSFEASVSAINHEINTYKIKTVIIDSAAKSVQGAFNDAEKIGILFSKLGGLKVENSLIIDHVAKGGNDPIGSITKINDAGNIWQIVKSQELGSSSMTVGFHHRKSNEGPIEKSIGIELEFEMNKFHNTIRVDLSESEVPEEGGSPKEMSTKQQILNLLRNYEPMPADKIADNLDIKKEIVAPELSRLKAQGKVDKFEQADGSSRYGIVA